MKLYSTSNVYTRARYFAGQTEAKKAAREDAIATNEPFDICEHILLAGKAGIAALANGEFESSELIATIKPRKARKAVDTESNPWD